MDDNEKVQNLSFRCIETFLSVAYHHNYIEAAREVGIDKTGVLRDIQALEKWMSMVMVMDGRENDLLPDGDRFVEDAVSILTMLADHGLDSRATPEGRPLSLRRSARSKFGTDDLYIFLSVAERKGYKGAGSLEVEEDRARDTINRLQKLIGKTLFAGYSTIVLTEYGQAFADTARQVISLLDKHRKFIPRKDRIRLHNVNLQKKTRKQLDQARRQIAFLEEKKRLTRKLQGELAELKAGYIKLNEQYQKQIDELGPLPHVDATGIVVPASPTDRKSIGSADLIE